MTHAVTGQILLSAPVANAGTFTLPYPTGETSASGWDSVGHILSDDHGNVYTTGFSVSFGASVITITNDSLGTIAAGRAFRLQAQILSSTRQTIALLTAAIANATGTAQRFPVSLSRRSHQASVAGTGAVAATITIYGSNTDGTFGELICTITLSGTTSDHWQYISDAPWPYEWAVLSGISGTGASVNCSVGV